MIAVLSAVAAASFFGSLHCVGMCGPLVAAGVAPLGASRAEAALAQGTYHVGRLATLAALGGVAGALGAGVHQAGQLVGLQRAAAVVAGVLLVLWGLVSLRHGLGGAALHLRLPPSLGARVSRAMRWAGELPAGRRALALGLLTPFLPCGWLALFALTAAGTGSALAGSLTLIVFGLASAPALLGAALAWRASLGHWRQRFVVASSILLVVVGALLVFQRSQIALPAPDLAARTSPPQASDADSLPCCSGSAALESDVAPTAPLVEPAQAEAPVD